MIFNTQHSLRDTFERLESHFMISFLIHDDSSIPHCLLLHLALPYLDWASLPLRDACCGFLPGSCIVEWSWIWQLLATISCYFIHVMVWDCDLSNREERLCFLIITQECLHTEFVEPWNCHQIPRIQTDGAQPSDTGFLNGESITASYTWIAAHTICNQHWWCWWWNDEIVIIFTTSCLNVSLD